MNSGREINAQPPEHLSQARVRRGMIILAVILGVATILRLLSAWYQGNSVSDMPGVSDQLSYDGLARRVVGGYGFSFAEGHWPATPGGEPTAHWSYLYTLYLSGVYALTNFQPVAARLLQALIAGVLHPWLTWRLGKRIFGPRVGLVAAAISAVYLYFVYYAGGLLTETFYFLGILWTIDCAMRIVEQGTQGTSQVKWRLWIEFGLAIGVTTLLRQLFLIMAPLIFLWVWWNLPTEKIEGQGDGAAVESNGTTPLRWLRWPALRGLFVTGCVIVLMIAPWTIRNYQAFGTLVPLNTNAGFAFFWGNHPIHGTRFMPLLPANGPTYLDLIPPELLSLNEGELDKALLQEGLRFVIADPVRYLQLSLSRTEEYFKFWPSADSGLISNVSRVGSFGVMLPFMLYGLWCAIPLLRRPTHPGQRAQIALLLFFAAAYTMLHLLTWTLIRYRLPVDAILLPFAALGICDLWQRVTTPNAKLTTDSTDPGESTDKGELYANRV